MTSKRSHWNIYNKEMSKHGLGHALWDPAPYFQCPQPGDVGYIRAGCFNFLFSAGRPEDETEPGVDVPFNFKQLNIGPVLDHPPRAPGYLVSSDVKGPDKAHVLKPLQESLLSALSSSTSIPSTSAPSTSAPSRSTPSRSTPSTSTPIPSTSTPSAPPPATAAQPTSPPQITPFKILKDGSPIIFRLRGRQGAALVTKYETYREDAQRLGTFEKYTKEHYNSWVSFARANGHGDDVNPVLVTGVERTRDFAVMAYSKDGDTDLECTFEVASSHACGRWDTADLVFTNCGPPLGSLSPQTMVSLNGYIQCVFVRYYTIRTKLWVSRIMRAGAGPHDLGAGDRENGEMPEVGASSLDSDSDVVVHNPGYEEADDFDIVADYVFQNSSADSVLLHHRDITFLRQPSGGVDLSTELLRKQPPIVVDEKRVGRIWTHAGPSGAIQPGLELESSINTQQRGREESSTNTQALDHRTLESDRSQAHNVHHPKLKYPTSGESAGVGTPTCKLPGIVQPDNLKLAVSSTLTTHGSTHSYDPSSLRADGTNSPDQLTRPMPTEKDAQFDFNEEWGPRTVSSEETNANTLEQLLETIIKYSSEMSTAKQETSQLVGLCVTLVNHLSEYPPTAQDVEYEDARRNLIVVEERLAEWSKYNSIQGFLKKKEVKAGVTGLIEKLEPIVSQCQATRPAAVYSPSANPSDLTRHAGLVLTERRSSSTSILKVTGESTDATTPLWKRLVNRAIPPLELISLVEAIFANDDEVQMICDISEEGAQSFIDVVHKVLDLPDLPPHLRVECLGALYMICSRQRLLPRSLQIPVCFNPSGAPGPQAIGGFAEIWEGKYRGHRVACKVLRVHVTSDLNVVASRFCREVVTWSALRHPNVLPLLGATMEVNRFMMVCDWMENGNINQFVATHREVNRFELLVGVAKGLMYIHGEGIVHGDLKGANVLIDRDWHPRLMDFGLSVVVPKSAPLVDLTETDFYGTTRWMSPELLDLDHFGNKESRKTRESDCYALGMVIFEVLSGGPPFPQYSNPLAMIKVVKGERPEKPEGIEVQFFSDDLWEMLCLCWEAHAENRPKVEAVLGCLEHASGGWKPLPESVEKVQGDLDITAGGDESTKLLAMGIKAASEPHLIETVEVGSYYGMQGLPGALPDDEYD